MQSQKLAAIGIDLTLNNCSFYPSFLPATSAKNRHMTHRLVQRSRSHFRTRAPFKQTSVSNSNSPRRGQSSGLKFKAGSGKERCWEFAGSDNRWPCSVWRQSRKTYHFGSLFYAINVNSGGCRQLVCFVTPPSLLPLICFPALFFLAY